MGHLPQLDSLRAFAVALVMWHHWAPRYQLGFDWGRLGVTLFFVLSGFLITGILIDGRNKGIPTSRMLGAFYARRFLRIFPLFYGILLLAAIANAPDVRNAFWWHAGFLSNFHFFQRGEWDGPASHFWSIAVEEQFYVVWAVLMLWLPRQLIVPLVALLVVASCAFRFAFAQIPLSFYTTPAVVDALVTGAGLAYARRLWTGGWNHRALPPALLAAGVVVCLSGPAPLFQTGCILASAGAIVAAVNGVTGWLGWLLDRQCLQYLGTISYGLYMFHNFTAFIAYDAMGLPSLSLPIRLPLFTALTVALAATSWHFFEKPINDCKRFFPYAPLPPRNTNLT